MKYCGRDFSNEEIQQIRDIIAQKPPKNRAGISRAVCEELNWYKQDGGLKDMSCRVALLRMEKNGLITLPKPLKRNGNGKLHIKHTSKTDPKDKVLLSVGKLLPVTITIVNNRHDSHLWNEYIDRYHYLGYTPLPGAQARYFVYTNNMIIALLGFGASAWKVAHRDNYIGWNDQQRKKNLHLIINNARFLILPWIRSKNLASKILSLISKRICFDWEIKYNYKPVLLETFVECERFFGTSYKSANWIRVGITKGRGKKDVNKKFALPKKHIYLYPLNKNYKKILSL